tara:strand:+ start:1554 stop:1949 length:396 start_codon:yes stop_codon:yes gene_type:complete
MSSFSKTIRNFLSQLGADPDRSVAEVPKSDSCANPGQVVLFRYKLGVGKGSRAMRIVMVTEPITKDAKTGNLLLTGFKLPEGSEYTAEDLEKLYISKGLDSEDYRTYIMSNIFGPLYRVSTNKEESPRGDD